MGVYVILDGVRREYPEATHWSLLENACGSIEIAKRYLPMGRTNYVCLTIAQYGRYDLVGWMEEKENDA